MTQTRMEKHEAVEVWIVGVEVPCLVKSMVVFYEGADLHLAQAVFNDGAKGVAGCPFRKGKFSVAVGHAFGPDEDEVEGYSGEEEGKLHPDFAGKGGLRASAENEEADWGRVGSKTFDSRTSTCLERVQIVS
jgi:hypothetical protein